MASASYLTDRFPRRLGLIAAAVLVQACGTTAESGGLVPDSATIQVYYIELPVGEERYTLDADGSGFRLRADLDYTERASRVQLAATLELDADLTPRRFEAKGKTYRFVEVDVEVDITRTQARVRNFDAVTVTPVTDPVFPVRGYAPLAGRAPLIAYWERLGRPAVIRPVPGRPTDVIEIEFRGLDTVAVDGRNIVLRRYMVSGVVWGREAVWVDESARFAAIVTRMAILPLEGVRSDLVEALPVLQASAVRDRMEDLERIDEATEPVAVNTFALTGASLIDGTGAALLADATIVIRDGSITAVGPRAQVEVPADAREFDATGLTILPGLWDMHAHASQIEWGHAYLAAGVTTARDLGGEMRFLTAFRDAIAEGRGLGPMLVLAGIVDGRDSLTFGPVTATTPAEGRRVVEAYQAAGFLQMKLYTRLQPEVVRAIVDRAHELGMTVTGHIPRSMSLEEALAAGMDGVAHLPIGNASPEARQRAIAVLVRYGTVVDPTMVWGELLGRSAETAIASFEPGIDTVAAPLMLNYQTASSNRDEASAADRLRDRLALVKAVHDAGVPIVAGTDGAVPGYSVLRELELYVAAGLTPMEAIQAATSVPARVMGMDDWVGTVLPGKRADLLIVEGDPLQDISNLRRSRWVVAGGRMYQASALRMSARGGS